MEDQNKYMRLAIEAAKRAEQNGGVAIGAVLVHNSTGNVISTGGSVVGITHDPTSHAEINCIRAACRLVDSDDLYDYTLHSTLEPCSMCIGAAVWARIRKSIFGAYRKDVSESLFDVKGDYSVEQEASRMNLREDTQMAAQGGVLAAECADLLALYHDTPKHTARVGV